MVQLIWLNQLCCLSCAEPITPVGLYSWFGSSSFCGRLCRSVERSQLLNDLMKQTKERSVGKRHLISKQNQRNDPSLPTTKKKPKTPKAALLSNANLETIQNEVEENSSKQSKTSATNQQRKMSQKSNTWS